MFRNPVMLVALGLATALFSTTGQAAPITLFTNNFNAENGGAGALNFNAFTNMNVSAGNVDLIGNGFSDLLPGNGLYVDLTGTGITSGSNLESANLALGAGTYTLSFNLAGNQRGTIPGVSATDTVVVSVGTLFTTTITQSAADPFTPFSFVFAFGGPATTGTLSFNSFGLGVADNAGQLLDNVLLTFTPAPEPASLALWGATGAVVGLVQWRRRRAARLV